MGVLATTWLVAAALASPLQAQTFQNPASISVPDAGAATAAQSSIAVSGVAGGITKLTVTLLNMSSPATRDLDVLLVGPGGQNLVILSDCGNIGGVVNVTITLDDAAAGNLNSTTAITSGTHRPTNIGTPDAFAPPTPAGPYNSPPTAGTATLATVFNGLTPNGTWTLYVSDDAATAGATSTIAGGWAITLVTQVTPTSTALHSSRNPSFTSSPDHDVTFTATVTSGGSPVTTGTVDFEEGGATLAAGVTLDGNGQATFTTTTFSEGNHTITARYDPAGPHGASSANLVQVVDNHTVVTLPSFCNPGAITIPVTGVPPAVYPSSIFVSGLGPLTGFTVRLANLTSPVPDRLEMLLVGPGGQKFVMMSDCGGSEAIAGVNLTLSDAASSPLPDGGVITSGTWLPTSQPTGGTPAFPAPAPGSPYTFAAPLGAGTFHNTFSGDPNGRWSLYVMNDLSPGGGGTNHFLDGGWCLEFDPGMVDVEADRPAPAATVFLARPSPAPMREETTLRFALPSAGHVSLVVYDAAGRAVRTLHQGPAAAGWNQARWDGRDDGGRDTGAGLFFARLHVRDAWSVQRIVRLR